MHPLAERVAATNALLAREIDDALRPSYPPAKARDKAALEQRIMDAGIAKNDAEWWAMKEIERLRQIELFATRLVRNIREYGLHDNWKPLAAALEGYDRREGRS